MRIWLPALWLFAACSGGDLQDGAPTDSAQAGASSATVTTAGAPAAGTPNGTTGGGADQSTGGNTTGGVAMSGGAMSGGATNGGATSGGATSGGATGGGAANPAAGAGPGSAGSAGSAASEPQGPNPACKPWPTASGSQTLSKTQSVQGSFDGKLQRFVGDGLGTGEQGEDQQPLFVLAEGATLSNVIIGAPAADGIHCLGSCTLTNVWWEDVGEDAATLKGSSSSQIMSVDCGGARNASDKVFQHNGPGTLKISNFYVESFGKLYRSCGNCGKQYARHVIVTAVRAQDGKALVGINENYGDSASFSNIVAPSSLVICQRYLGNDTGAEPTTTRSGPDDRFCLYQPSDIHRP